MLIDSSIDCWLSCSAANVACTALSILSSIGEGKGLRCQGELKGVRMEDLVSLWFVAFVEEVVLFNERWIQPRTPISHQWPVAKKS